MARWHLTSHRKPTGGILSPNRKKMKMDRGTKFLETKVDKKRAAHTTVRGGARKVRLLAADEILVSDKKTGKTTKSKMITVTANPTNPHYVRRNIITKGAVVKTDLGSVRITSRPSQSGIVSGVLISDKK